MGVVAFLAGLVAIGAGIGIYYAQPVGGVQIAAVSVAGGALGTFISASCFSLYRRSMTQADYFYANLVRAQDTMIAITLCERIKDREAHAETIREVIRTLLERPGVKRPAPSRWRFPSQGLRARAQQNGPPPGRDEASAGS